jgi:hypothetical protein
MDFLKKHYEKIILAVVLLGLAAAVGFLPFKIASEQQELADKRDKMVHRPALPLTNLNLALPETVLKRMPTPALVDFSKPHKLFNPMKWQKAADEHLIKVDAENIGPHAVAITKISPLYTVITLDSITEAPNGARYRIGVKKEASPIVKERTKTQKYCAVGDKNDTFKLESVGGSPDNPTTVLILNDTGERATISTNQPFQRVDGYLADLRYEPEKLVWTGKRVNSTPPLHLNNEDYKIVAINKDEVILLAPSTKKTTIKYKAP